MGTHSALLKGSHTRAHTPKQGPSLPRPQCGFALPVNSFLFRHAFIYIHFPVHCEPPLSAERKIRRNCRHKFYPQPLFIPIFNFSHKLPTFAFTSESGYTHSAFRERSHTRAYTPKHGHFRWGWYHYPRSVPHVHQHSRAGYQNGKFCRFWGLVGGAPKERREPSGQRCAYARRCPEASRPRWAA